jgi:hypothetical protein
MPRAFRKETAGSKAPPTIAPMRRLAAMNLRAKLKTFGVLFYS